MRGPEIIERLAKVEDLLLKAAIELGQLKDQMRRRKPLSRGPVIDHMTDAKRERIRELAEDGWPANRIAKHMKINQGRVSEVLRGKRT